MERVISVNKTVGFFYSRNKNRTIFYALLQSEFAISIKMLIKNKLKEGKSEEEIYDHLKRLYGEWIVYDPEFSKKNLILWLFPLILFIFGGLLIYRKVFIN